MPYFMFFFNRPIELTFNYFFVVFECSLFMELQLKRYNLLLFLWLFIHQVLFFEVLFVIFVSLIVGLFFRIDSTSFYLS